MPDRFTPECIEDIARQLRERGQLHTTNGREHIYQQGESVFMEVLLPAHPGIIGVLHFPLAEEEPAVQFSQEEQASIDAERQRRDETGGGYFLSPEESVMLDRCMLDLVLIRPFRQKEEKLMNKDVKMLRRALEEMQNAMSNLYGYAEPCPQALQQQVSDANTHASFALRVTSGDMPPGYSLDKRDVASGRIHPRLNGEFIIVGLSPKYCYDPFEAALFCWEHHASQKEEEGHLQ